MHQRLRACITTVCLSIFIGSKWYCLVVNTSILILLALVTICSLSVSYLWLSSQGQEGRHKEQIRSIIDFQTNESEYHQGVDEELAETGKKEKNVKLKCWWKRCDNVQYFCLVSFILKEVQSFAFIGNNIFPIRQSEIFWLMCAFYSTSRRSANDCIHCRGRVK